CIMKRLTYLFLLLFVFSLNAKEENSTSVRHANLTEGAIRVKTMSWPELEKGCCAPPYSGDCHQIEGTLVLQDNGKAHFSCVTWTDQTHSGDYWHVGFEFLDHSGVSLFHSPMHMGPRMDDGHPSPRYRWEFDFNFDPALFDKIVEIRQSFSC
ncbi:MAG TPA: DUF6294 family protein, partial [Chlamydiales bacterium]|nr:DUF6294 family protein [Chlamydiales bacterium]